LAWQAPGEYHKAIGYYEQALASDLRTYGRGPSRFARDRNNLGSAWHDLGEYHKAIGYYEQALVSDLRLDLRTREPALYSTCDKP